MDSNKIKVLSHIYALEFSKHFKERHKQEMSLFDYVFLAGLFEEALNEVYKTEEAGLIIN